MKLRKVSVLFVFLVLLCALLLIGCQSMTYRQQDLEKMGGKKEFEDLVEENLEVLEEAGKKEEDKYFSGYGVFSRDEFFRMKGASTVALFFYKEWCEKCMEIEEEILANKGSFPSGVKVFKVNADEEPELMDFYGVTEDGTVVILDETGKEKYNGVPEKFDKLLEELNNVSIK